MNAKIGREEEAGGGRREEEAGGGRREEGGGRREEANLALADVEDAFIVLGRRTVFSHHVQVHRSGFKGESIGGTLAHCQCLQNTKRQMKL